MSSMPQEAEHEENKHCVACGDNLDIQKRNDKARYWVAYGKKTPDGIVFPDLRRSAKTGMVRAGVNKIYRDLILGHSLQGVDVNYIVESGLEDELRQAMEQYSEWLLGQVQANIAQNVAQAKTK